MNSKQKKEVEMKFFLKNYNEEEFASLLDSLGAEFVKNKHEKDTYFNVSGRDSLTTKECLRVRETDSLTEITYKPPSDLSLIDVSHFAKLETNLNVSNADEAINLLELLGNTVLVAVDKNRSYYQLGDVTIALDHIKDAGTFVEIEIETEDEVAGLAEVKSLAGKLGLHDDMIEYRPYRDIVLQIEKE